MDRVLNFINDSAKSITGREIKLTVESSFSSMESEYHVEMSSIEIITLLALIEEEYDMEFDKLPDNVCDLMTQLHALGGMKDE